MKKACLVVLLLFFVVSAYSLELSDKDAISRIKHTILKEPKLLYPDMEINKVRNLNLKLVTIIKIEKTIRNGKNYFSGRFRVVGTSIVKLGTNAKEDIDNFDKVATFYVFFNSFGEWETRIFKAKDNDLKLEKMCRIIDKNRKTGLKIRAKEDIKVRYFPSKKTTGFIRKSSIFNVKACISEKDGYWAYSELFEIPLNSNLEFFTNTPLQLTDSENKLLADIKNKVNNVSDYLVKNKNYTSITTTQKNIIKTFGSITYKKYCGSCHQKNGEGIPSVFPSLKSSVVVTTSLQDMVNIVVKGKRGTAMQAFGLQLSQSQLSSVIAHVRNKIGKIATTEKDIAPLVKKATKELNDQIERDNNQYKKLKTELNNITSPSSLLRSVYSNSIVNSCEPPGAIVVIVFVVSLVVVSITDQPFQDTNTIFVGI